MALLQKNKVFILFLMVVSHSCHSHVKRFQGIEDYSIDLLGADKYREINRSIIDTLKLYTSHRLETYSAFYCDSWEIDKIIAINSQKNKIITTANFYETEDCSNNKLVFIYGVLIESNWFYFRGATQYLFGERPLSFEELHELAVEHVYRGYLRRTADGDYEINDGFFENMGCTDSPRPGYCQCKTCETFEDWVLYTIKENWQRRDTTDWEQLRRDERSKS